MAKFVIDFADNTNALVGTRDIKKGDCTSTLDIKRRADLNASLIEISGCEHTMDDCSNERFLDAKDSTLDHELIKSSSFASVDVAVRPCIPLLK